MGDQRGPRSIAASIAGRALLAAGVLAAIVTAAPLAMGAAPHPGATQDATQDPTQDALLLGQWRTYANGDRPSRAVRQGDLVWVGTDAGGLVRWDLATREYHQYLHPQDGLPSNDVNDVEVAADGTLWLATGEGLVHFDPAVGVVAVITPDVSPDMPANNVTALASAPDGDLWVGFAQAWDFEAAHPDPGADNRRGAFLPGGFARYRPAAGAWSDVTHVSYRVVPGSSEIDFETIPSENVTDIEVTTDGILWIGTRPFLQWEREQCVPGACTGKGGAWLQVGGGLAAYADGRWQQWWPEEDGSYSCYGTDIADLAGDAAGRLWVGTLGRGVLVMTNGLLQPGCASQVRYGRERLNAPGLHGLYVWSVDVDDAGRVWMGHGDGPRAGRGIAVLDHGGTLDDWSTPWESDDEWRFADFDGVPGKSKALVTTLLAHGAQPYVVGARDEMDGDGFGMRLFDPSTEAWQPLRTSDTGLPSNQIVHIARDGARGQTWFALLHRGVARYDEADGTWHSWRAFANQGEVAVVLADADDSARRVRVSMADRAAFDAAFPSGSRLARFGNDSTLYEVTNYTPPRGNDGPWLYISPDLVNAVGTDSAVYGVTRGLASDDAQHVAVDAEGGAWVGGAFTMWRTGQTPGANCPTYPQCYLDGGLAHWDGTDWTVYNDRNSGLPKNGVGAVQVGSVAVDLDGRIWAGTGDRTTVGYGIGVFEPAVDRWTTHTYRAGLGAGDGAADIDVDPETGHVYTAHYPVVGYVTLPNGQQQRYFDGGGVARWDGAGWRTWAKPTASLRAFGDKGMLSAILVDRVSGYLWAGGWDGDPATFHWQTGIGLDAALNWCVLADCEDGGWQNRIWPGEGLVAALALDGSGRLWAGVNRAGAGIVPPEAGVKLLAANGWHVVTPDNSDLAGAEVSALAADGVRMWVGTLQRGVSLYDDTPPPTATPTDVPVDTPEPSDTPDEPSPSPTGSPTPSDTPTPTADTPSPPATETATGSATPDPDPSETATATESPSATTPTPEPCPAGRCRIALPAVFDRS